jgi:phytoene desaturase
MSARRGVDWPPRVRGIRCHAGPLARQSDYDRHANTYVLSEQSLQQAMVVDNIEREKRMLEASRQSERRLAAQKQALELAASGATIGVVLSPVAEETRSQVSGDARVALFIVDPNAARLHFGAAAGMSPDYACAVDGFEIRPLADFPCLAVFSKSRRMVYAANFSAPELKRAPEGWYFYCGASVPRPARGQFDVEEEKALLLEDLREHP